MWCRMDCVLYHISIGKHIAFVEFTTRRRYSDATKTKLPFWLRNQMPLDWNCSLHYWTWRDAIHFDLLRIYWFSHGNLSFLMTHQSEWYLSGCCDSTIWYCVEMRDEVFMNGERGRVHEWIRVEEGRKSTNCEILRRIWEKIEANFQNSMGTNLR